MTIYTPGDGSRASVEPSPSDDAEQPDAPLAGLLTGRVLTRKRAYLIFASAALVVSFAPDVVTAGVLSGHEASALTMWASLASSLLLKIGTAFGFIAAANTGK